MHIAHRGTEHLLILKLKPLADLVQRILVVCALTGEGNLPVIRSIQDGKNVCVALYEPVDHVELGIDALNQTVHRGVQLVFRVASLDVHDLAVDNDLCTDDSFFNIATRSFFQNTRLLLPLADNVLNAFGKLRYVPLLDILADLHRLFQLIKIRRLIGEHNDCFIVDLRIHNEPFVRRTVVVACNGHNAKPHSSASRAIQGLVNVLVIGKVILVMLEFLGGIYFSVNRLCNAGDDLRTVNRCVLDVDGNVLFLVRQEGIGIAVARNVVLREKPFQ